MYIYIYKNICMYIYRNVYRNMYIYIYIYISYDGIQIEFTAGGGNPEFRLLLRKYKENLPPGAEIFPNVNFGAKEIQREFTA